MNKYKKGMEEITASEELKQQFINRAQQRQPTKKNSLRRAALFAAACSFIVVMVFGASFLQPDNKSALTGFVITAYAADGAPVVMKPNVLLPLGTYSPLMSSVPGFPIRIDAEDADRIEVIVTEGVLLTWSPSSPKVVHKGKSMQTATGNTLYWSPIDENNEIPFAKKSLVSVIAYKNKQELSRRVIEIQSTDSLNYSGLLKEE
ncbi:hypothetical protein [Candidatus Pristimantibacillus sp. PTI5]|uniref:hypothetical protein n=1 Tax=Candidatus Pristimantibacillus sp. PTI5 TaxID=3400422 RepID=UPI003B0122F7